MKIVLQRVSNASVRVGEEIVGCIGPGYVALLGIAAGDTKAIADRLIDKIKKLRIFPDEAGKTNRSISDINGELLVIVEPIKSLWISQFPSTDSI